MSQKKPNILMVVENSFPNDIRVRKEVYHLSKWYRITVIAIKRNSEKYLENRDGISIIRLPELPDIDLGRIRYILQYFYFTITSAFLFLITFPVKRYRVVHVHNPPDTLFVLGLLCKVLRVKFIFDHHDLAPNLYRTRFSGRKDFIYNVLLLCEKLSCKLADVIIATNNTYRQIEIDRHGVDPGKIYIVRNNPIIEECVLEKGEERDTSLGEETNRSTLLFIGAINPQDGVAEMLKALHLLVNKYYATNFICNIVGGGDSLEKVKNYAVELNIEKYVNFTGMIYDRKKIKEFFHDADIGLEPAPENNLNLHSTFIKVMEYMAAGIPTVAFDLKETRFSAGESALLVPPGDIEGFAGAINTLLDNADLRRELGSKGAERIRDELSWDNAASNLEKAYARLSL